MKWLTKIGQIIIKATEIAIGLQPFLPGSAQGGVTIAISDLQQIEAIIVNVEAVGQAMTPPLTGEQKLAAATPLIAQILLKSTKLAGHEIANQALFVAGAEKIAGGMADVLNARKA